MEDQMEARFTEMQAKNLMKRFYNSKVSHDYLAYSLEQNFKAIFEKWLRREKMEAELRKL